MPIENSDGLIEIAVGRSRRETRWKNKEMLWSELVQKLSETHRTAETHSEYMAAKKPRQDEIKDIGGFVGGFINGGRRLASSVLHRQLITLDIDFCNGPFWEDLTLCYDNAALLYSTHKHSPDSPRLRLVMPLDRPVRPDEYEAIARKVAGVLDIEVFDPTTFQPERLMYWPSTPKDGDYVFEVQAGPWLCADEILAGYKDWQDSSQWPVSRKVDKLIKRGIAKQGDPLEKPGVIGAFCRTYNIHEAIDKYLQDVYAACDVEDRYSYLEGSTAAGLITYEDKFAFSHHGSDPVSGKLCNAFDLVRIHLFGLKDEDAKEGTPTNKMPSYVAMADYATQDAAVKKKYSLEKFEDAKGDFAGISNESDDIEEPDLDWVGELEIDKGGNFLTSVKNLQLIMENDPGLKNRIGLNEFAHRVEVLKPLPWDDSREIRLWTDDDWGCLRCYLGVAPYNIMRSPKLEDVMSGVKKKNTFHPVRDYLKKLSWDKTSRVDSLFIDYLGAEDTEYTRAVTRKTLVAAVARVFRPGVKFDYVLTLVGKQGTGKSTIIKKLGGEWYSDTFNFNMLHQGKQAFEQIQGVWLVEIGEMVGLKKADVEAAKNFISSASDMYRPSHARETVNRKRQCVFIGTTNSEEFLKSANGNRRFWPVDVQVTTPECNVWEDLTREEIDQIWAEAVALYKAGEPLNLTHELEEQAMIVQEKHEENDERAGLIEEYLRSPVPENWEEMGLGDRRSFLQGFAFEPATKLRTTVCVAEIWCELLGGFQKDMTTHNTKYIHDILRKLEDWQVAKTRKICGIYGKQTVYLLMSNGKIIDPEKDRWDKAKNLLSVRK